jgi:uncharacterized damage-inducible protein DinB
MEKTAIVKYWDNVRHLTLDVLEHFPADSFGFRPKPEMRSVAEQFSHILAVELGVRNGLILNMWEAPPSPAQDYSGKEMLKQTLRREHGKTSKVLRVLPPEAFGHFHETRYGRLSAEALIYMAIDEEIHHRGNLYVYLRLLDIVPPQMVQNYGELFMEDKNG